MSNKTNNLFAMRHSLAHVMMQALEKLYQAKPGVGPAIDDGFYHDFECGHQVSDEDFPKIEAEMKHIIFENLKITKKIMDIDKGIEFLEKKGYLLTKELAEDLKVAGESKVSFYEQGNFINMCKGPHVTETGKINPEAFKLVKVAGAYWKGDEKNKMIQRIYGLAFETKENLEKHLEMLAEAEKRDHRKLGKELDLFTFSELVGAGLPLFTPKGTILRRELQNALWEVSKNYNMQPVSIPHIAKKKLYETSGHADKFGDELIKVISHYDEFVMKPVNCPHHTQIYASRPRSYRDLPIRYIESTIQYRDEKPGEIGGLTRVRAITVDDGHTFCTVDQIKVEVGNLCQIIKDFYKKIGLWGNHWVSLSVRNPQIPDAYIGEPGDWDHSEKMLEDISKELKLKAKRVEGEAAIYGPKIDYMFKDSLGREWQLATVQLDFSMPKRFGLTYTDNYGNDATPVMIHRAILGSYERFLAVLIEHFAGAFPVWLSPVQVKLLAVSEKHIEYCQKLAGEFTVKNIRTEVDSSNEMVGNKIRKAVGEKVPYMLVIGDREMESENLAIRDRGSKDIRKISKNEFFKEIKRKIRSKK